MSDTTKALEDLKATHAKMAEEIKALETKITEEAKAKRPELEVGQIWSKIGKGWGEYIVYCHPEKGMLGSPAYTFVKISGDDVGCPWVPGRGFDGDEDEFTCLGTASDLLTIKEPSK